MDSHINLSQTQIDAILDKCKVTSPQARKFVVAFFECDHNGAAAMRATGYEGGNARERAYQLMKSDKVRDAIAMMAVEVTKHDNVKVDFVLRKLLKGAEKAEDQGNLSALARFLELIAKHLGMFTEKIEHTGKDGEAIQIEQRTREDVSAFKSAIDGLVDRGGARKAPGDTKH